MDIHTVQLLRKKKCIYELVHLCVDPSAFLLVAAQYSLRRIALDNPNGEYVDVPLYDARDGFKVNAVDYFMTSSSEGFVYFAEMRPPAGVPGDLVWK